MSKITRKQLLKGSAVGAAALAAMPAMGSVATATPGGHLAIHIHAILHGVGALDPSLRIAVNIDVAGRHQTGETGLEPLSGSGWDPGVLGTSPANTMVPIGAKGACYFTQAGHLDTREQMVHLRGFSLFTNRMQQQEDTPPRWDTREDLRDVETHADLKTGFITWRLGTATFAGTGEVVKIVG
jgi:hypothetical protein